MSVIIRGGSSAATATVSATGALHTYPFEPERLGVLISATGHAVSASGTESLMTLVQQKGPVVTNTATSFVAPAGKRFRVQSMILGQVHNTQTSKATTLFRFRINATGAVTSTSTPIMLQMRLVTTDPDHYDRVVLNVPGGFDLPGDGVAQFGVSIVSTYAVLNNPTVDLQIVGYEY